MLSSQLKLSLSYYSDLYDMIVPKDHILRKIRELVDFSFIYDFDNLLKLKDSPIDQGKENFIKLVEYALSCMEVHPVLDGSITDEEYQAGLKFLQEFYIIFFLLIKLYYRKKNKARDFFSIFEFIILSFYL